MDSSIMGVMDVISSRLWALTLFDATLLVVGTGLCWLSSLYLRSSYASLPLPPGPRPLPIIGNILDLPKGLESPHWAKHRALYGPISSIHAFGHTYIIVNDASIAFELLEKRSSTYSSRPTMTFAGEMCGFGAALSLLPYGEFFRVSRRRIHNYMGSRSTASRFDNLEEIETRRFLLRLLRSPQKFSEHIRTTAGAIILKVSHGYTIEPEGKDRLVELAGDALDAFSDSVSGPWMVDIAPSLRYLPDWFPGAQFKKIAHRYNILAKSLNDEPFAFVQKEMAAGTAIPSFTSSVIESGFKDAEDEHLAKWAATSIYGGGADTTVSAVATFFLAMALYPEVMKRAQQELDSVIGTDNLPRLADRERLPYVDAVMKESLRWNTVLPMGLPHASSEADTYTGYHIPKGAVIMPNIWFMCHDPEQYHDPFTFKPERFLPMDGRVPEADSRRLAFGFGRRICPGKEIADASLFLSVAMTLAVFNITKAVDDKGNEVQPLCEYTPGIISHPKEFECSINPRSEKAIGVIRSVLDEHPFEPSSSSKL